MSIHESNCRDCNKMIIGSALRCKPCHLKYLEALKRTPKSEQTESLESLARRLDMEPEQLEGIIKLNVTNRSKSKSKNWNHK